MIYHDVIIVGAGPGGIKAALELKKNDIDFIIMDYGAPGGKINIAPRVDNYLEYPKISGPDLAMNLFMKLMDNDISIVGEKILSISKEDDKFIVKSDYNLYQSKVVLLASGCQEKELNLPNEKEMFAHGLSYCALCDGHFFKNQDVAVIGGGNAAFTEAAYLASICKRVYLIHRRKEYRAVPKKINDLKAFDNVTYLTPYICISINGKDKLESITIKNVETNELEELKINGLFPLIGQNPNTDFIDIDNVIDSYRFVPVDENMMSSCKGLFAIGDVLPRVVKQIFLAEKDALKAVESIKEYLNEN